MAFSFDLGLAISAERYGAISAGPEQHRGIDMMQACPRQIKIHIVIHYSLMELKVESIKSQLQSLHKMPLEQTIDLTNSSLLPNSVL